MDTEARYRDNLDFYVQMGGEGPPDFVAEHLQARVDDPDDPLVSYRKDQEDFHQLNEDVPVDGYVHFYYPDRVKKRDGPAGWRSFSFPFRDHRKDDAPWFAFPDADKWERHPVWKWKNPDLDPHEHLTLKPSLGVGGGSGSITFHCWIEDGQVRWV